MHGNMTKMPHLPEMIWDYKDNFKECTLDLAGNKAFYTYDAAGNRVRKVVIKNNGSIVEDRIYINNYEIYRKTTNGTLNIERETLNIIEPVQNEMKELQKIAQIDGDDTTTTVRYKLSDHLGSASLELDENAEIISYEEYYPFGSTSYRSGRSETEVSQKRYKYVMKELDNETGLYYYGARYYASWIARFISVDPLQHKYPYYTPFQYAGNKPITFIDLDGAEEYRYYDDNDELVATIILSDIEGIDPITKKIKGFSKKKIGIDDAITIDLSGYDVIPDAIGWGVEGSETIGGGMNYGLEFVTFTKGENAFETQVYGKLGANVGLEMTLGPYAFVASYHNDESEINPSSWEGWFSGYSGGYQYGGSGYFWSTEANEPEIDPFFRQGKKTPYTENQAHDKVWEGYNITGTYVGLPSAKVGGKWFSSYYWHLSPDIATKGNKYEQNKIKEPCKKMEEEDKIRLKEFEKNEVRKSFREKQN